MPKHAARPEARRPRSRAPDAAADTPPCYVIVHPGLEEVASEEIERDYAGEIKKTYPGVVVFRVPEVDRHLLRMKTSEDLFVLAWGTDELSYRAEDLDKILRWTQREPNWQKLLSIHHAVRPKPRGKPTYRLVVQMTGEHGYRRVDAQKALARGLAGKLPASWRHAEENASIEIWLTIHGATAVCGIRLSDRTMRHRTYKSEHFKASLRPTVAAAMVRLADIKPGQTVLDPMCGAGTILAETWLAQPREKGRRGEGEKGRRGEGEKGRGGEREKGRRGEGEKGRKTEGEIMRRGEKGETLPLPLPISPSPHLPLSPSPLFLLGGDLDDRHVRAAAGNLHRLGPTTLKTWDARKLPLESLSVDRIVSNPPFGKEMGEPEEIGPLYRGMVKEMNRVLRPGGKAVLIVADIAALREAVERVGWKLLRFVRVRVLGQRASIQVYRKPVD